MQIDSTTAAHATADLAVSQPAQVRVEVTAGTQSTFPGTRPPKRNGVYPLADGRFSRFLDGQWRVPDTDAQTAAMQTRLDAFSSPQFRTKDHHRWFDTDVSMPESLGNAVAERDVLRAGAYLAKGMTETELSDIESANLGGESDAVDLATKFARSLAELEANAYGFQFEFPGVFAYEVSEEMGRWLRANTDATQASFAMQLHKTAEAFFDRDCAVLFSKKNLTANGDPVAPGSTPIGTL